MVYKWRNDELTSSCFRGIDSRGERRLVRIVRSDRRATLPQITNNYNNGDQKKVSQHTVQRSLLRMGLRSRRPSRVPLLTAHHRQQRLQWAREHRNWTIEEWKAVTWSDELRFLIHNVDSRVRIRRFSRNYGTWMHS